jgi:hypothetical protein
MWTDRWTERHDDVNSRFSKYGNAPKINSNKKLSLIIEYICDSFMKIGYVYHG